MQFTLYISKHVHNSAIRKKTKTNVYMQSSAVMTTSTIDVEDDDEDGDVAPPSLAERASWRLAMDDGDFPSDMVFIIFIPFFGVHRTPKGPSSVLYVKKQIGLITNY